MGLDIAKYDRGISEELGLDFGGKATKKTKILGFSPKNCERQYGWMRKPRNGEGIFHIGNEYWDWDKNDAEKVGQMVEYGTFGSKNKWGQKRERALNYE